MKRCTPYSCSSSRGIICADWVRTTTHLRAYDIDPVSWADVVVLFHLYLASRFDVCRSILRDEVSIFLAGPALQPIICATENTHPRVRRESGHQRLPPFMEFNSLTDDETGCDRRVGRYPLRQGQDEGPVRAVRRRVGSRDRQGAKRERSARFCESPVPSALGLRRLTSNARRLGLLSFGRSSRRVLV